MTLKSQLFWSTGCEPRAEVLQVLYWCSNMKQPAQRWGKTTLQKPALCNTGGKSQIWLFWPILGWFGATFYCVSQVHWLIHLQTQKTSLHGTLRIQTFWIFGPAEIRAHLGASTHLPQSWISDIHLLTISSIPSSNHPCSQRIPKVSTNAAKHQSITRHNVMSPMKW